MLSPGVQVGKYVIVRRAAVGATSDVYEGGHPASGNPGEGGPELGKKPAERPALPEVLPLLSKARG